MGKQNDSYDEKFADAMAGIGTFLKEKLTEEDFGVMGKATKKLKDKMPDPGLKVGGAAPDFTLQDATGSEVTLSEELKEGPVVLLFYRGSWCPVCNVHLNALMAIVPILESDYGARIIAVTPQMPDVTKKQLEDHPDLSFKVLHDRDDAVAKSYNLYFEMDSKLNLVYKKLGINVGASNGDKTVGLPVPATFVIDKGGTVVATQADTDYMNRMKPDEIIAGLEATVEK